MAIHGKHLLKNRAIPVRKTRQPTAPYGRETGSNALTPLERELSNIMLRAFDRVPARAYETMLEDKTGWQYEAIFTGALMSVQDEIADVLHRQLVNSGKTEAIDLGRMLADEFRVLEKASKPTPSQMALGFRFDVNSKQALDWAKREAGQLVTNMGAEQKKVIGQLINQSMTQGLTRQQTSTALHRLLNDIIPGTEYGKVTARTIGANMNGLTAKYEQAVWNRAQKVAQDLTDRGITGTKAVEALKKDTDKYAEKLRKARARTIARTEIVRAAEEGRQQSWNQAIDQGLINKTTATKTWRAGPYDVCPICTKLHGTSVPVQGEWPNGVATPPAHPNCRCSMVLNSGVTEPPRRIGDGTPGNPFKLEFAPPPNPADFPPLPSFGLPTTPVTPAVPAGPQFQPATRQVLEDMIDRQRQAAMTSQALPELEESLVDYTNGSGNYSLVNDTLRGKLNYDDLSPTDQKKVMGMVTDLDELITANVRTQDDVLLFRGVKFDGKEAWDTAKVGDVVTERGFSSTSVRPGVAERFARKDGLVLEIEAPKGTKGILPDAFRSGDKDLLLGGDAANELEYLLPRNTRYEVISRDGNRIRVRIVDQIDPEPFGTSVTPLPPAAPPTPPTPPTAPTPPPVPVSAPPPPVVPAPPTTPAPAVTGPSVGAPTDPGLRTLREALDLPTATRGELKNRVDRLNEVVDAIDEIHYIPNDGMKNTTVRLAGTKNQGKGGHFSPGTRGPKPRRAKGESYSDYYDRIRIWAKKETNPEILVAAREWEGVGGEMNSFAHELGHRIDRYNDDYYTRQAWFKYRKGESLNEGEQAVVDLIEAVKETASFKRYYGSLRDMGSRDYFGSPHEIWARSYNQWIGDLSQNKKMMDAIEYLAEKAGYQYTKEEWETIGPLVTRIMEKRGLMKVTPEVIDDVVDLVEDIPLLGRYTPPPLNTAKHDVDYFKKRASGFLKQFQEEGGMAWDNKKNNIGTRTLWKEQGFNAKPTIVTEGQYADLEATGWTPMYRGLNADTDEELAGYLSQFLDSDDPYAGSGLFGTGHYTTNIRSTAESYAEAAHGAGQEQREKATGKVLDILLHKDAKVIDLDELHQEMRQVWEERRRIEREIYGEGPDGERLRQWGQLTDSERKRIQEANDYEGVIYEDPGRFATMLGYDAIRIKNPVVDWATGKPLEDTFHLVLNRGALAVKGA